MMENNVNQITTVRFFQQKKFTNYGILFSPLKKKSNIGLVSVKNDTEKNHEFRLSSKCGNAERRTWRQD